MALLKARTEFALALNQICHERGLDPADLVAVIEEAVVAAFKKDYGAEEGIEYEAKVDQETGQATLYSFPEDDPEKRKEVTPPGFGRIAAQVAKQVILQKIREAEKNIILAEYEDRVGQPVNGMVLRFEGPAVVVDIGKAEGLMPVEDQIRGERYNLGQRMTVLIADIRETMKGRRVIVSRAADELVESLFKREVPEVASGAVEIQGIAREPGQRTKIAVASTQPGVDPVGSCVGQKGVRVQAVINELNGEKIDIVPFSSEAEKFIIAALSPAENVKVVLNEKTREAEVIVPEDQLSLAIGKDGQNVRLAAKLTGFKIEINDEKGSKKSSSPNEKKTEGWEELGARTTSALEAAGIDSLTVLKEKDLEELAEIKGIGPKAMEKIRTIIG